MKEFKYVVKDPVGIHARPAGLLVGKAKEYQSKIVIAKGAKSAEATRLFSIMSLGVKCNDEIVITVDGIDEEVAYTGFKELIENNL